MTHWVRVCKDWTNQKGLLIVPHVLSSLSFNILTLGELYEAILPPESNCVHAGTIDTPGKGRSDGIPVWFWN